MWLDNLPSGNFFHTRYRECRGDVIYTIDHLDMLSTFEKKLPTFFLHCIVVNIAVIFLKDFFYLLFLFTWNLPRAIKRRQNFLNISINKSYLRFYISFSESIILGSFFTVNYIEVTSVLDNTYLSTMNIRMVSLVVGCARL